MSRKININKYEGNTHYSISVQDSFDQEHHVGYEHTMNNDVLANIEQKACDIWANESKRVISTMDRAISECIQMDIDRGVKPILD